MSNWKAAWALSWLALVMAAPLYAERVALVIGNGAYRGEMPRLPNPGNDARAMAAKLRGLGFAVVEGVDLDRGGFFSKLKEFSRRAEEAEAALLFYAGHGVQVEGKNYLIPVSMETLEDKTDLRADAVNLDYVLEQMKGRTNLVFLDACRNNPLTRGLSRSSGGSARGGLAMVSAESMGGGVLIGYAAQPDATASDGSGRNSPYTEALLKHLGTPGESAGDMLTRVKADVEDATRGEQHPWVNASLRAPFYFVRGAVGPITDPVGGGVSGGSVVGGGCDVELLKLSWETVKDAGDEDELQSFIEEHEGCRGAGVLVKRAKNLLEELARVRKAEEEAARAEAARKAEEEAARAEAARKAEEEAARAEAARKAEEEAAEKARAELRHLVGRRVRDCDECPQMVVIPAGSFMMGSPESEEGRYDDEGPAHRVEIGVPFAVGIYEVTFEEWDACVAEGGCEGYRPADEGWGRGKRPVINVNWKDAQAYVEWLSRKTGEEYRLLSEAEWEYAARAGSRTWYSFGDDISKSQANYSFNGNEGRKKTVPVGKYGANGYGLYDMHGNVWEWVQDCVNDNYVGAPTDGKAWESGNCVRRVLRGGSWRHGPVLLRSATRIMFVTDSRSDGFGFRVARTLRP